MVAWCKCHYFFFFAPELAIAKGGCRAGKSGGKIISRQIRMGRGRGVENQKLLLFEHWDALLLRDKKKVYIFSFLSAKIGCCQKSK
jgi:hypothetical protein